MQLKSRKKELQSIVRYKQNPVCKPMYYTTNVWIHVQRVTMIARELCKQLRLDDKITQQVIRYAMFHDDTEIITGDYATPEKQSWSEKRKLEYEKECENAIPLLVAKYGTELGDDYESILHIIESKDNRYTLQLCILEYADKLDALLEVFHELYSESTGFLSSMKEHFQKDMTCWEYVIGRVERRFQKLENIYGKLLPKTGLFNISQLREINISDIASKGIQHTEKNIFKTTNIDIYDTWKNLHFLGKNQEEISYLYTQNIT